MTTPTPALPDVLPFDPATSIDPRAVDPILGIGSERTAAEHGAAIAWSYALREAHRLVSTAENCLRETWEAQDAETACSVLGAVAERLQALAKHGPG